VSGTAEGKLALGDLANHFPANDSWIRGNLEWGEPTVQQVLDTALAWGVLNNHFDVADFLLGHGADINTNWSSHEPASILHELVCHKNYEAMQFLIDRGIGGEVFAPASAASPPQVCRAPGEALAANVRRVPEDN
jgi:hypothetical protein